MSRIVWIGTRASLNELERIMTRAGRSMTALVILVGPRGAAMTGRASGRFSEIVDDADISARGTTLRDEQHQRISVRTDRLFTALLAGQWLTAIVIALDVSPMSWSVSTSHVHAHVWFAGAIGGLVAVPPSILSWQRPSATTPR